VARRTWQVPMDEMTKTKTGSTHARHIVASRGRWPWNDSPCDTRQRAWCLSARLTSFLNRLVRLKVLTCPNRRRVPFCCQSV
jgi:hypothetical protein